MKILISGATGFVGKYLVASLLREQYSLVVIGRSNNKIKAIFGEKVRALTWSELDLLQPDDIDAVINLVGENISSKRWDAKLKSEILASRVSATEKLAQWCLSSKAVVPHLYNASAVGIYGSKVDQPLSETSQINWGHPSDFLSEVGQQWEQAAKITNDRGFKFTFMRFGVVVGREAGMLAKLLPSFKLGLGSIIGSGDQMLSWIQIDDLVAAILFLLKNPELIGPVNLCSPNPVSQKQFAAQLALILNRPLWLRLPEALIKIIFGQMGEELLLGSQNIRPECLQNAGFKFSYPDISSALKKELSE